MKIIMVIVSSLNGKLTKGDDSNIYTWTSKEDQEYFFSLLEKNRALIMGSKTYNAVKKRILLRKNLLRIILTKEPKKYAHETITGQLEFSDHSPHILVKTLETRGYKKILIVGGAKVNTSFLKAQLVDELYLTLEPRIFGKGNNIFQEGEFENRVQLRSVRKLNKRGTILLKYKFIK